MLIAAAVLSIVLGLLFIGNGVLADTQTAFHQIYTAIYIVGDAVLCAIDGLLGGLAELNDLVWQNREAGNCG